MLGWLRRQTEAIFGAPRSGKWPRVRRDHLEVEPRCIACGRDKDLEVHHVQAVKDRPDLELSPENLVTLCADPCHFVHGHLMDWKRSNPEVREDCKRYMDKIQRAKGNA